MGTEFHLTDKEVVLLHEKAFDSEFVQEMREILATVGEQSADKYFETRDVSEAVQELTNATVDQMISMLTSTILDGLSKDTTDNDLAYLGWLLIRETVKGDLNVLWHALSEQAALLTDNLIEKENT